MSAARLLIKASVNGREVSFFTPPHDEPDFLWVDIEELAGAFLDPEGAKRMVQHTQNFDRDRRPMTTAQNGNRIATIVPHAFAQGLCGAIDQWNGFVRDDEEDDAGPAHQEYCLVAGTVAAEHWPLSFEEIFHAFKNPGGPFLRA